MIRATLLLSTLFYFHVALSQQPSPGDASLISADRQQNAGRRVGPVIDINCGGPAVGRFEAEDPAWIRGKTSANPGSESFNTKGAEPQNAPALVSHRWGMKNSKWGYTIPVKQPGLYDCALHFAETSDFFFGAGKRVFNLEILDRKVSSIDIFKEAGAPYTSVVRSYSRLQVRDILKIELTPVKGDAILSAITCEKVEEEAKDEININCGGGAVGRFKADNTAWVRGDTGINPGDSVKRISGAETKNAKALVTHRWGRKDAWGYTIPVKQKGRYDCNLHFAETSPFYFKEGARVFNIDVMGETKKEIDVYAEAGGSFKSVVKTFRNVNIGKTLKIDLTAVKGDPFLAAITCKKRVEDTSPDVSKGNAVLINGDKGGSTEVISCDEESLLVRTDDPSSFSAGRIIWSIPSGGSKALTKCSFVARKIKSVRKQTGVSVKAAKDAKCPPGATCFIMQTSYATIGELYSPEVLRALNLLNQASKALEKLLVLVGKVQECLQLPRNMPTHCSGWNRIGSDGRCVFSDCFVGRNGDGKSCLPKENGCGPKNPVLNLVVLDRIPLVFDFRDTCCSHDKCYTSHTFQKIECDCAFLLGNLASCKQTLDKVKQISIPIAEKSNDACKANSLIYFAAVLRLGKTSFKDARKEREEHEKKDFCVAKCPSTQKSGGRGTTTFSVDLKKKSGTFKVGYEMYTIKDGLQVFYEGKTLFQTGSGGDTLVSGSDTADVKYSGNSTVVQVKVTAPNSGTRWSVNVDCPK